MYLNNFITYYRRLYSLYNRKRLKNRDFSIIASNCIGGSILHDLGLPFNSPFINLWLKPSDFLKFCEKMDYYLSLKLRFTTVVGLQYPVGVLGDILIFFQHYATETEAEEAWNRRKKRIRLDNLFVIFTDRDGCTYDDLLRFDRLKIRNKVVFTHVEYKDIVSAFYIPGFEEETSVGHLMCYKNKYSCKKYYDAFDYVSWFNKSIPA
ncbi:MAG: DUF1919 domain-containing protein [Bacteroidales bacterium]|nr:DUF1919 domain-containing protein [Bacteroidales bacterium]